MPRRKRELNPNGAYHIYSRANNKMSFGLPIEEVWSIFTDYLFFISHAYKIQIHAFTLMSNHFHLQASDPSLKISQAMNYLIREVSREINRRRGTINHVFGGRTKMSIIDNPLYYVILIKYLYRNPIKANLVDYAEEYPWSSLQGLIGKKTLEFPVWPQHYGLDNLIPENYEDFLSFLNQPYSYEQNEVIKKSLQRYTFKINEKKRRLFDNVEN